MFKALFRSFWFRYLFGNFRCYRRWYGGRWEYHWIDVCGCAMWLDMQPGKVWPDYRQPCSFGTPIVEDHPVPPSNDSLSGVWVSWGWDLWWIDTKGPEGLSYRLWLALGVNVKRYDLAWMVSLHCLFLKITFAFARKGEA